MCYSHGSTQEPDRPHHRGLPQCHQSAFPAPAFETGASVRSSGQHIEPAHPNPSTLLAEDNCIRGRKLPKGIAPRHERNRPPTNGTNPAAAPRATPHPGIPPHRTPYRLCQLPPPAGSNPRAVNARTRIAQTNSHRARTNPGAPNAAVHLHKRIRPRTCEPKSRETQMEITQTNCRCARANPRRLASLRSPHAQLETRMGESRRRAGVHPLRREEM